MACEWTHDEFTITCDPARIDVQAVHSLLVSTYWAAGIPFDVVSRAVSNSLCFGLLDRDRELRGFARVVTDRATFAYLCDVIISDRLQGDGLGKWLVRCVMSHPDLQGLRRFNLVTRDAHGLYAPLGFTPVADPDRYMERLDPDVYKRASAERLSTDSKR